MVPYNLMKENGKAAYLDSGTWASAAIKEAKFFGETVVVASSKEQNYNHIPKDITFQPMQIIFTVRATIRFLEHK
jgi:phosphoserine aminotransferase